MAHTMTATCGAEALREALPALDEFAGAYEAALDAILRNDRETAVGIVAGTVPHLVQLAEFLESVSREAPELQGSLMAVAAELETRFGHLLAALESCDMVAIDDCLRHLLIPLIAAIRGFFADPSAPAAPPAVVAPQVARPPTREQLQANLRSLEPLLVNTTGDELRGIFGEPSPVAVREGAWRLTLPDDQSWLLHSRFDPRAEAQRQVAAWMAENPVGKHGIVVVIGAGGLYHVDALLEHLGDDGHLVILEPDLPTLARALASRDLRHLQVDRRLLIFAMRNRETLARSFYLLLRNSRELAIYLYPLLPWTNACAKRYDDICECLLMQARAESSNRCTLAAFSDEWQQNAILNLARLARCPGVSQLVKRFSGYPALVVAAGPSLNDSMELVRAHAGQALVIAVGTSLRPLLSAGIRPHIVVQIDSDPATMVQFEGLDTDDIFLVAANSVYPEIVSRFGDRVFSFSTTVEGFSEWLEEIGTCQGPVSIGGTVTLSAIDIAVQAGCSPVFTFGLDLAMKDDGQSHASNSMYDDKGDIWAAYQMLRVPGNFQESVPTVRQFAGYIEIISSYIEDVRRNHPLEIHNITSGGARIAGLPAVRPDQAEPLFAGLRGGDASTHLLQVWEYAQRPDPDQVTAKLRHARHELAQLHRLSTRAMRKCTRAGRHSERQARFLRQLERIDEQLKDFPDGLLLIDGAIKAACMHLQQTVNEDQDVMHILKQSRVLYQQIAGAADWLRGLLAHAEAGMAQAAEGDSTDA